LIRIHTIKLTRSFYVLVVLLAVFLFFIIVNNFIVSRFTAKDNNQQVISTFSYLTRSSDLSTFSKSGVDTLNFSANFFFKNLLAMEIPYLKFADESIDSARTNFFSFFVSFLTSIDLDDPMSFVRNQIPYMASANIKPVLKTHEEEQTPPKEGDTPKAVEEIDVRDKNKFKENNTQNTTGDKKKGRLDNFNTSKPFVLIYHTHTTEAYSPSEKVVYDPQYTTYHSRDFKMTVVEVGKHLKKNLEENHGIKVIHDTTIHDLPSYAFSYANSLRTFKKNLEKYSSIKIAIDLHRDAPTPDPREARKITTTQINGEKVAKIMLVVGTDRLFEHPNWKKNYGFALKLQAEINKISSSLTRKIDVREERFNQHLLDKSLLIEVGSTGNTIQEALRATDYLADAIARVVHTND